ncbi:MAG: 2-C-methyl-D-erythritol 2,4-cyclodiphosphate synthase [Thermodesulfovibrionales bacterium]|nr:2-C-methyl-D-erythritol 2,4-cyclodiphosphate synthase [Thermodesulfovibrionales bacterium]
MNIQIGIGYDSHRLVHGRNLIIGGVQIPHEKGLMGHSDADVLIHAIIDAILGSAGLGDIGSLFPDTDNKWKDANSLELLKIVNELIIKKGFEIQYIDSIVIAERPKIAPYIEKMRLSLSNTLGISINKINIKAKTNEGMGFIGKCEGIAAQSVCLLSDIR